MPGRLFLTPFGDLCPSYPLLAPLSPYSPSDLPLVISQGSKQATVEEILKGNPSLPPWFSSGAQHFITLCLTKDARKRPNITQLAQHPWIQDHVRGNHHQKARERAGRAGEGKATWDNPIDLQASIYLHELPQEAPHELGRGSRNHTEEGPTIKAESHFRSCGT